MPHALTAPCSTGCSRFCCQLSVVGTVLATTAGARGEHLYECSRGGRGDAGGSGASFERLRTNERQKAVGTAHAGAQFLQPLLNVIPAPVREVHARAPRVSAAPARTLLIVSRTTPTFSRRKDLKTQPIDESKVSARIEGERFDPAGRVGVALIERVVDAGGECLHQAL